MTVGGRHRHAVEQASRRWRGGRRDDSARTRRKILIFTQVASDDALWAFSNEAGLDGPLDPSEFALHVPEAGLAQRNASLLETVDAARSRLDALRSHGSKAAWAYRY